MVNCVLSVCLFLFLVRYSTMKNKSKHIPGLAQAKVVNHHDIFNHAISMCMIRSL